MKYVIVEPFKPAGVLRPKFILLFSEHLNHADMVPPATKAVAAGFCNITPKGIVCHGKSETLKIKSHPKKDSNLISTWIATGESMMMMASEEYDNG